ncbi:MAG TPA: hypothetical protein VGS06_19620 [Streptosporangiaceae bacterium]|nr:hypothetical protein [Streptosporangiaceae bacterium]
MTSALNSTAPVLLLLKTWTTSVSGVVDVGVADSPSVPPDSLTITVSTAVHVTPLVALLMVNLSVALPVAVPVLVSTSWVWVALVVSTASVVPLLKAGEATKASPLGAVKVSVLPIPVPLTTPLTTAPVEAVGWVRLNAWSAVS